MKLRGCIIAAALSIVFAHADAGYKARWRFGAVITPEKNIWMAGYASRKAPAEGKEHELFAKAFAIEDPSGARAVIVTTDLVVVSSTLTHAVFDRVQTKYAIPRERFMMTASHTHSGPVTNDRLYDMYGLDDTQSALIAEYTATLPDKIGRDRRSNCGP